MTTSVTSKNQLFKPAEAVATDSLELEVFDDCRYIGLSEGPEEPQMMLNVEDARVLRDWLNKVLP